VGRYCPPREGFIPAAVGTGLGESSLSPEEQVIELQMEKELDAERAALIAAQHQ
jgi:hypothetical protein